MEEIMQSNSFFIIPLTLAYLIICGLWFFLDKRGWLWEIACIESPKKPWIDMIIGVVAAVGILAIGQLFSAGYLINRTDSEMLNLIIWPLNNVIIFSYGIL